MRWASGLVACVACGGAASSIAPSDQHRGPVEYAQRLVTATSTHDVAGVRSLLGDPVTYGGLWFDDSTCRSALATTGDRSGPQLDALAGCLAKLDLRTTARRDALSDVAVFTYGPGFEVEARFADTERSRRLTWIGYSARLEGEGLPTVTAEALEALRTAGDRDGPIDAPALDAALKARAWLKVCVDPTGAVSDATVRETTSSVAAKAFVAAARAWQFRPFVLGDHAAAVCAMFAMKFPAVHASDEHELLPLPLPMRHDQVLVPQDELRRVSGDRYIVPDDPTKIMFANFGISQVVGSFKLCLNPAGEVTDVVTLRSTRSRVYDAKIQSQMKWWRYEPFLIDGKPKAVCTAITFIYSQR